VLNHIPNLPIPMTKKIVFFKIVYVGVEKEHTINIDPNEKLI
jgi:hypothetical protein